jgi:phosphoribosylpyrophosphate synthetase
LYLDPNQLPLIQNKKCVLIDDAISSGKTLKSSWDFLESDMIGAKIEVVGVCMKQGERWRTMLDAVNDSEQMRNYDEINREKKTRSEMIEWVFESPLLKAVEGGWVVRD